MIVRKPPRSARCRAALVRLVFAIASLAWASGCGSGSSGFDPEVSAAAQSEQGAIRDAVEHGTCALVPDDFLLCGVDAPPSLPTDSPGPGVPLSDTGAPISSGIRCLSATGGCAFSLAIHPEGYGEGSEFLGAVRRADFTKPWQTSTTLFEPSASDPGTLVGEFATDLAPGDTVFVAILSYPPRVPVPDVPRGGLIVDVLTNLIAARADVIVDVPLLPPGG